MKGKSIYVLQINHVFDYDVLKNDCEVFENIDDAKQELKKIVGNERKYIERDEWVIETDTDLDFEAYLDGEYSSNHLVVSIDEKIVK